MQRHLMTWLHRTAVAALSIVAFAGSAWADTYNFECHIKNGWDVETGKGQAFAKDDKSKLKYYHYYGIHRYDIQAITGKNLPVGTASSIDTAYKWLKSYFNSRNVLERWIKYAEGRKAVYNVDSEFYKSGSTYYLSARTTGVENENNTRWMLHYYEDEAGNRAFRITTVYYIKGEERKNAKAGDKYNNQISGSDSETTDWCKLPSLVDVVPPYRSHATFKVEYKGLSTNATSTAEAYHEVTTTGTVYKVETNNVCRIVYTADDGYYFPGKETAFTNEFKATGAAIPEEAVPQIVIESPNPVKDDNDEDVIVRVPATWVEQYKVTDITADGANGIPNWQNYALGLDPTNATSQTVVSPVQTDDANNLTLTLGNGFAPKSDAGVTMMYQLGTNDVAVGEFTYGEEQSEYRFTVPLPSSGVKYYNIRAKFYKDQD